MRVEFDVNGSYVVRFPLQRATAQILKLGEAFLRKEDQRAAGARTIYTEDIRGLVARGTQSVAQKSSSEGPAHAVVGRPQAAGGTRQEISRANSKPVEGHVHRYAGQGNRVGF